MPLLSQQTLRRLFTLAALTLLSATLALAQDASQLGNRDFARKGTDNWGYAATIGSPHKKLFVLTMTDPTHRRTCRVESITADQLVCRGPFNQSHIYRQQDIAALTIPGDNDFKVRFVLTANAVAGAAIWGTIVLAPVCPACAAGTVFAALASLLAAGAVAIGDDQPESLLYLAPGQTLQVKLRY